MSESNKFDVLCSYPYLRRMNIQEAHDVTTLLTSNKNKIFLENWNQVIWNSFQSNAIRSEKNGHKEPSWPTQNLFYSDDVTGRWSDGANRMIFLASIRPQVCAGGKGFSRRSFEIPADIVLPIDGFFPLEQHRDLQFFLVRLIGWYAVRRMTFLRCKYCGPS